MWWDWESGRWRRMDAPGDHLRFYEIDPAVIRIARNPQYFTYLGDSRAPVEIVEGDGRVSLTSELERDGAARFDFLIIDAFSSDAIPVHLLTREAFEVYAKVLQPKGLLAIHASNRRLDLTPIVARVGESAGFSVVVVAASGVAEYVSAPSRWVFLSRDGDRIRSLVQFAKLRRREAGLAEESSQFLEFSAAQIAKTPSGPTTTAICSRR